MSTIPSETLQVHVISGKRLHADDRANRRIAETVRSIKTAHEHEAVRQVIVGN